jgi:uncharacterized protein (TIGR04222 family)
MSLGPFDLYGDAFLKLYALLFFAVVVLGFLIPHLLRSQGREQTVSDVDQIALLSGGPVRLCEAAIAHLMAARAITMVGDKSFGMISRDPACTALEHSIVNLPNNATWKDVESTVKPYAEPIAQKLAALGLMIDEIALRRIRRITILPYCLLIGFGLIKCFVGITRDRPILFLVLFLFVTAICAIIRYATVDRRTQAGLNVVKDMRETKGRLRAAPMTPEVGIAVALFGTTVLVGSEFARFHQLRNASSGDGGGSSGGDGDGGGGGGCGGCGGD